MEAEELFYPKRPFPKASHKAFRNPEVHMHITDIVRERGYEIKRYPMVSEDGYISNIFRLSKGPFVEGKPVVLMHHGILTSGVFWLCNETHNVLAFQLCDTGYDVWIMNGRGTEESKKHINLKRNSREYWQFGWEEMARLDTPVLINLILKVTSQPELIYVGHSMGCSILFAAVSFHPEISKKIKLMIALAPAVYVKHGKTILLRYLSKVPFIYKHVASQKGRVILRPTTKIVPKLSPWLWVWKSRRIPQCTWWLAMGTRILAGKDNEQEHWDQYPALVIRFPSPCSIRTYQHFAQLHTSGRFQRFDFGKNKNLSVYGTSTPPLFDLSKSTFPVAIFYGENDYCVQPKDVERLSEELPNVVSSYKVKWRKFNHTDFTFAKDVDQLLNCHVMSTLNEFCSKENTKL